jgi:uncharacterized protein YggU (UPF0235/DUF167 family)
MRKITVIAKPSSGINVVEEAGPDTYVVRTTKAARGGEANDAVLGLLAAHLGIGKSRLRIRLGKTAREKLVEIWDC